MALGFTTRSKKRVVTKGIFIRNKKLLVAPGLTSSQEPLVASLLLVAMPFVPSSFLLVASLFLKAVRRISQVHKFFAVAQTD